MNAAACSGDRAGVGGGQPSLHHPRRPERLVAPNFLKRVSRMVEALAVHPTGNLTVRPDGRRAKASRAAASTASCPSVHDPRAPLVGQQQCERDITYSSHTASRVWPRLLRG